MITVRIFLMGLVALVPAQKTLTVVVSNATDHDHVPVFVWDSKNNSSVGEGDDIKTRLRLASKPNGYLLKGYTIEMSPFGSFDLEYEGGLKGAHSHRRLTAAMPSRSNADDFSWVLSMERLTDGLGYLDPVYYSGEEPKYVAGRMWLSHGKVKTYSLADTGTDVPALRFVGVGKLPLLATRQAVADIVVIEVKVDPLDLENGAIKFELKDFAGTPIWTIPLEPKDDKVDVLVGNLTRPLCAVTEAPPPALHFDLYHSMLALRASYEDRVFPVIGKASMAGDGVDAPLGDLPAVIRVVSKCILSGGIARPICMLGSFQAPE